jgi:Uma2 family endonuclease
MAITQREMTLEEFLELPERKPALEYEEGRITQKVSPKGRHSRLQFCVAQLVNQFAEPGKLAMAFPELRVTFAGRSRVPDVSIFRWDRIPRDAHGRVADDFQEPPDVAVEIVSPKQGVNQLIRRCLWYVDHGTQVALLIDTDDESVAIFRPGQPMAVLRGTDRIDLDAVLHGLQLTVQELFDSLIV